MLGIYLSDVYDYPALENTNVNRSNRRRWTGQVCWMFCLTLTRFTYVLSGLACMATLLIRYGVWHIVDLLEWIVAWVDSMTGKGDFITGVYMYVYQSKNHTVILPSRVPSETKYFAETNWRNRGLFRAKISPKQKSYFACRPNVRWIFLYAKQVMIGLQTSKIVCLFQICKHSLVIKRLPKEL